MFQLLTNSGEGGRFPATDWDVIRAAGTDEADAGGATIRICEIYWQPVYHFIRRSWPGKSADEALEATNEFFTRRLEERDIRNLDPQKGQFRSWIRSAASNFVRNARRASLREQQRLIPLDANEGESSGGWEPRASLNPELLFERELALSILNRTLTKLEQEYAARGDADLARNARSLLVPGEAPASYAELERRWGLSEGSLKVRLYTMRRRMDTLLRLELGLPPYDGEEGAPSLDCALGWLKWALALKEEQPCPKSKSLRPERESDTVTAGKDTEKAHLRPE